MSDSKTQDANSGSEAPRVVPVSGTAGKGRSDFPMVSGELRQYVVLLLPGFSNLVLGSATAPIMATNSILGEDLYCLRYVGFETSRVQAEAGNWIEVEAVDTIEKGHALLICGGSPVSYQSHPDLVAWVRANAYRFNTVAGLATGGLVMAEAGLLVNHRAAIHWWNDAFLFDQFPNVRIVEDSFVVDRNRASSRGGTSTMDMMTFLLARDHGAELAESLAQHFIRARIGGTTKTHRKLLTDQQNTEQPKLQSAIELMEANIEEPLSTDDLAGHIGISRRQLERLFKKYLDSVPSKYYQQIRLERARNLLHQSSLSIMEIALQCGYSSGAHLSTSYRNNYGMTPSEERRRKAQFQ
ncbi:GlxA family transcriptional regulator [Litoribrevibacter albus]|uniref:AraC family transcriptional regulator n=1 Tax=Litoribrevibacter albus TaxID=1473156 RepID=A0AA37SG48_9GAMM|nr:GlxA family transcriptional regulator [Litoribrevibacter albus]GLQ33619.1 AraC family transcriptional regulator [Litoribrevibacter albus]